MADCVPILEFQSVTVATGTAADVVDLTLSVAGGELVLVRSDPRSGHAPLPDLAAGLIEPDGGQVRFMCRPWSDRRPSTAARARGRIGRFFADRGWVNHLDVDENVTLRERHHTRRPAADIAAEAGRLARAVGLPDGLPTVRPGQVDPRDLQRAACVRMLLGSPRLILFDEPTAGLPPALVDAVAAELRAARRRGAAVVWFTADPSVWRGEAVDPTRRLDRTGRQPPANIEAAVA